ncbi:DeoR family transcriptional regulator [Alkalispirillum mobile]|uniref:DeoR family transcriptional regulator n=1 Tax=Alkalispirillum mobile TaxID=85925 RepID=A0A498CAL2_9GAMM|nr:DeoR/GlpR family DNA-binding transcription regulator [Alkalispirillum mobile]RLK51566.1 DeoR family transcriptional regulator [Alkalispirillum mobile]
MSAGLDDQRLTRKERWLMIENMLEARPVVLISELASQFSVSVETVRRDIDAMAEAGLLERTYGGAAALKTAREPALNQRATLLAEERERIARVAAGMVRDGQVLMLDACATCLPLAQRLVVERRKLKVVTNSFALASAMAYNTTFQVIMAGGFYNSTEGANYGSETTEFLRRFTADHCFSSCGAVTAEGPTEVDSDVAGVKRVMLERAHHVTLLADHDKFRRPRLERVASLSTLDTLITDQEPPPDIVRALADAGVRLRIAGA